MRDLEEFSQRIKARLAEAQREPKWQQSEADRYMAELGPRRRRYEGAAARLVSTILRPRLECLASHFKNAKLARAEHDDRCACWFGYSTRFPASVKVELSIEHDERIENIVVHYEIYIMPVFIKYDAHDKLTLPLDAVDEQVVAGWVEEKLLAFLETYLRLGRGEEDFEAEVVTDPVCGMRISAPSAVARMEFRGHPYFFCTEDCQRLFAENPKRYVRVVTE